MDSEMINNLRSALDQIKLSCTSIATATEVIIEALIKQTVIPSTQSDAKLPSSVDVEASNVESERDIARNIEESPNSVQTSYFTASGNDESAAIVETPVINRKRTALPEESQAKRAPRNFSLDVRNLQFNLNAIADQPMKIDALTNDATEDDTRAEPLPSNATKPAKVTRPRQTIDLNNLDAMQTEPTPESSPGIVTSEQHLKRNKDVSQSISFDVRNAITDQPKENNAPTTDDAPKDNGPENNALTDAPEDDKRTEPLANNVIKPAKVSRPRKTIDLNNLDAVQAKSTSAPRVFVAEQHSKGNKKVLRSFSVDVRNVIVGQSMQKGASGDNTRAEPSNATKPAKVSRPRKTMDAVLTEATQTSLNVNAEQYSKNTLYDGLCLYCGSNERFIVAHYLKHHPELEVPIARPSPNRAAEIRSSVQKFSAQDRKIKGICYFCEESKELVRANWVQHYLKHTGERMFACDTCDKQFERRCQRHANCSGKVLSIIEINSTDTAVVSYMCKDCNYMQFHLPSMHKHLEEQHKYAFITEGEQYDKVTLIPDMLPVQMDVLDEYDFIPLRFNCTICHEQLSTENNFIEHFDQHHSEEIKYDCLCGEPVLKIDGSLNGKTICNHLSLHSEAFHQCLLCDRFFDGRNGIREHILTSHRGDNNIKYRQFYCTPGQRSRVSESTILKFKCNLCCKDLNATFATLLDHFNNEHTNMDGDTTIIVSKKATLAADGISKAITVFVGHSTLQYKIAISTE